MKMHILALLALLASAPCARARHFTLVVDYPVGASDTLFARGSGCGLSWTSGRALQRADGGHRFTVTMDTSSCGAAETLEWKVTLNDQQWSGGANYRANISSINADASSFRAAPFFHSATGSYRILSSLYSSKLQNSRDIIVYFPPGYDENPYASYRDVVIMHDGENLFNDSTSFGGLSWRCQDAVEELIGENALHGLVIVGLYNTADRMDEYTYVRDANYTQNYPKGDIYLDFIEDTVLPYVKRTLRVDLDSPDARLGIIGSSLGGLISCYAGYTRNTYSRVGCMSSSFWWAEENFLNKLMPSRSPRQSVSFYLDSGSAGPGEDDMVQTEDVRNKLEADGLVLGANLFYYLDHGGEHNEYYWGRRFHEPLTALYAPVSARAEPAARARK